MNTAAAERLIIKNRAELLRTIKREGLVIRVLRHWQPNLANTTRTVQKAQTNGYFFYANDREGKRVRMWADIPKASSILFGADGEITFYPGEAKHWTITLELPTNDAAFRAGQYDTEGHQHATRAEERICEAQQEEIANTPTALLTSKHKVLTPSGFHTIAEITGFTDRDVATILHGLRLIQCEGRIEGCGAGACEHFDDADQLTNAEIDELVERINLGPIRPAPVQELDSITAATHLSAALDCMDQLAEYLKEAHSEDYDSDHSGDGPEGCTYCAAITEAEEVKAAAVKDAVMDDLRQQGLKPRERSTEIDAAIRKLRRTFEGDSNDAEHDAAYALVELLDPTS